uniref:Uncharacterized protein n=1 Tax=Sphaerodactylus townsendi TaxID=933632 RepID=A0ACB8F3F8_9SAUR
MPATLPDPRGLRWGNFPDPPRIKQRGERDAREQFLKGRLEQLRASFGPHQTRRLADGENRVRHLSPQGKSRKRALQRQESCERPAETETLSWREIWPDREGSYSAVVPKSTATTARHQGQPELLRQLTLHTSPPVAWA